MSSTTRDELLRDLFDQLNSLINVSSDSHSTAVCHRAENKRFRVYPYECGSSFRTAVTAFNPRVAIKGRTSAVRAVLANSSEADKICLDGSNYIPVVNSFMHLSNVDSSQCATLVREEAALVAWSDSDHDVVEVFRTFEHRLQHLSKLCHCNLVSCISQDPDSSLDVVENPEGRLFTLGGTEDSFLSYLEWPEPRPDNLTPLFELPELNHLQKTESSPGGEARDPLDSLSGEDESSIASPSILGPHRVYAQADYLDGTSPYISISPSETLYDLSSRSGSNMLTGSSSGMSLSPAMAHPPASAVSRMMTVSPMLTISPTVTIASNSLSPQPRPSKLRDFDDAATLAAASIQDIADALQASSPVLEPSQLLTPANAYAAHVTPSPAAQTAELTDDDEEGEEELELDTGVFLLPQTRTHGRSKSTGGAAPVASSSRLPILASRATSMPHTPFASRSSTPHSVSPLLGSTSGRDERGSLARFHATTSALGSYTYASDGPSSRAVGQKSKRSQYEDDSDEEDFQEESNEGVAHGKDEIDELSEDEYEDGGEDDDDDDDEYVQAFSPRPSGKRARSSSTSGPASASTSTAPPPQKKRRMRRRKTTTAKKPRFACPDCGETFGRKTDLKRHAGAAKCNGTGGQKETHKCELCPKEFLRSDALKRHKKTVHRNIYCK